MATTVQTPATKRADRTPMTSTRKTALVAGVFYLITFVSIPTLALYGPVKNHRGWIISSGAHTGVVRFDGAEHDVLGGGHGQTHAPTDQDQTSGDREVTVQGRGQRHHRQAGSYRE